MSTYDNNKMQDLTQEERIEHYSALFAFWASVAAKIPSRFNNQALSQYRILKEKAINE